MPNKIFAPDRRNLIATMGAAAVSAIVYRTAALGASQTLRLEARSAALPLRPGLALTPIWGLQGPPAPPRFKRGQIELTFRNGLPAPVALDWRGLDGAAAAEPLTSHPAVLPGAEVTLPLPFRHSGTFFCDLRLVSSPQALPSQLFPVVVEEGEPIAADRDEVLLIEDWRLTPDGTAAVTGAAAPDAPAIYTLNGQVLPDISLRSRERLRLRVINGCQRQVIAAKVEGYEVRVIAMDGAPAEPFLARNSALVLAPGGRADALIDATAPPGMSSQILLHDGKEAHRLARLVVSNEAPARPSPLPAAASLPTDGLPTRLDLKGALRIDLALEGGEWVTPASFSASAPPAFKATTGRTIVLALSNPANLPTTFHLHGHHFRLLDRLDDGWKPFWLDTLAVEPGQTQRIAFAAEFSGRWLLDSTRADWAAPKLVRWYSVE